MKEGNKMVDKKETKSEQKSLQEQVFSRLGKMGIKINPGQPHLERDNASLILNVDKVENELILR